MVANMMHNYQQHHFHMATALGLTEKESEGWCQQWHMYKRDLAVGITFSTVPESGTRFEPVSRVTVCVYLQTLLRVEVAETALLTAEGHKQECWVRPNPDKCPFTKTWEMLQQQYGTM